MVFSLMRTNLPGTLGTTIGVKFARDIKQVSENPFIPGHNL